MGKRELLIISVFLAIGVVAYQLTAPPPTEPARPFTLSNFIGALMRGGRTAQASTTQTGTIELSPGISELRIGGIGGVEVTGEPRSDIAYTLRVTGVGQNEDIARRAADRATLSKDEIGPVLAIRTTSFGRQGAHIALHVPKDLAVRIDSGPGPMSVVVSQVSKVHLEGVVGDAKLQQIAGSVSGTHRNGELRVAQAASLAMTLVASRAFLEHVAGALTLSARNGHAQITESAGPVDIEAADEDVTVSSPLRDVRVRGTGGEVTIERPRDNVMVDFRRARIDLVLDRPAAVTALTTDATLRLVFAGDPHAEIEAVATDGGVVRAEDFSVAPRTEDGASRLQHVFEPATSRITLRNQRGEIVIARMK